MVLFLSVTIKRLKPDCCNLASVTHVLLSVFCSWIWLSKVKLVTKPILETNFQLLKSGFVPFLMSIILPLLSGEPSGFSIACIICVLLINMIRACSLLRLLLSACKSRELYFITFRVHKIIYENTNHSLLVVCWKFTDWMKI